MRTDILFETINSFMHSQDIDYIFDDKDLFYNFEFEMSGDPLESLKCYLSVDPEGYDIICGANIDVEIKEETKNELEKLLFAYDCRMFGGVFQIADDKVRYVRCMTICGDDAVLTDEMLEDNILSVPEVVENRYASIVSVIEGKTTAEEEIKKYNFDE